MKYPPEFPTGARARVEAETLRAYAALEQDIRGTASWQRDVPFVRCVMRVFIAFVREACVFGKESKLPAWSDRELDQRCRDFLLSAVIDAWEDKAKDRGVNRMVSSRGWGYSLDEDARRKFEASPEWRQYQELLLDAYEAQSDRVTHCSLPQCDPAGDTARKKESEAPPPPLLMLNEVHPAEVLPAGLVPIRRAPKDFVDATKRRMGSYEHLAARIGIGKDTLYAITKETRWVSDGTYILVAQSCGCSPEDLHPRDIPRPDRRPR